MFPCSHTFSYTHFPHIFVFSTHFRTVIFRILLSCSQKLANVPLFPSIFCQWINSVSTHPLFYLEFVEIASLAKYVTISTWRVGCELAKTQGDWEENNISVQTKWRKSVQMNIRWTRSNVVVTKHGLSYQPKTQPLPRPEMHDRDSLSTKLAVNGEV